MNDANAESLRQEYTPEVRRAAARVVVAGRIMNGQHPEAWAIEAAELDHVPVPRKIHWWERFRRRGTAI